MPAGRFTARETADQLRRINSSIEARQQAYDNQETRLRMALHLIKTHITDEQRSMQNEDLHNAIGLIVDFARKHGHLER